ncbi:hypothetical protein ABKN59_011219 [Abortiporus biennis]
MDDWELWTFPFLPICFNDCFQPLSPLFILPGGVRSSSSNRSKSVTTMETSRDIDSGRNIEDENVAEENVAVPGSSGEGSHIVSEEDELKKLGLERPQVLDARHNAESQRHRPTGSTDSSALNRNVTNQNTSQPDVLSLHSGLGLSKISNHLFRGSNMNLGIGVQSTQPKSQEILRKEDHSRSIIIPWMVRSLQYALAIDKFQSSIVGDGHQSFQQILSRYLSTFILIINTSFQYSGVFKNVNSQPLTVVAIMEPLQHIKAESKTGIDGTDEANIARSDTSQDESQQGISEHSQIQETQRGSDTQIAMKTTRMHRTNADSGQVGPLVNEVNQQVHRKSCSSISICADIFNNAQPIPQQAQVPYTQSSPRSQPPGMTGNDRRDSQPQNKNRYYYKQNALQKTSEGWSGLSSNLRKYDEERIKRVNDDMDTLLVFAAFTYILTHPNYGRDYNKAKSSPWLKDLKWPSETTWDRLKYTFTKATREYHDIISKCNWLQMVPRVLLLWGKWLLYSAPREFFGSISMERSLRYEEDYPFLDEKRARDDASMDLTYLESISVKFMDNEYFKLCFDTTRAMQYKDMRRFYLSTVEKLKHSNPGGSWPSLDKDYYYDASLDCLLFPKRKALEYEGYKRENEVITLFNTFLCEGTYSTGLVVSVCTDEYRDFSQCKENFTQIEVNSDSAMEHLINAVSGEENFLISYHNYKLGMARRPYSLVNSFHDKHQHWDDFISDRLACLCLFTFTVLAGVDEYLIKRHTRNILDMHKSLVEAVNQLPPPIYVSTSDEEVLEEILNVWRNKAPSLAHQEVAKKLLASFVEKSRKGRELKRLWRSNGTIVTRR